MPHTSALYGNTAAQRPPGMRQIRMFAQSALMHKHTVSRLGDSNRGTAQWPLTTRTVSPIWIATHQPETCGLAALTIFIRAKRDQWSRPGVVAGNVTSCRQRSSPRGASQLTACPRSGRPERDADAQLGLACSRPDGDRAVVVLHDDAPCDVQAEAGAFACVLNRIEASSA